MPKPFIIVTGADEAYSKFAGDLITSLERFQKRLRFDIGLLDYGLTPATRSTLQPRVTTLIAPPWPFRPDNRFDKQIQARAFATRPFLPDYFTGYDAYAWIDADSFVQDARGLVLLMAAAQPQLAGVVPTVDRSYRHTPASRDWVRERYRMAFGVETAQRLAKMPYIASGVVSASATSRLWPLWRDRFQSALDQWDGERLCDQAILNHVVYLENTAHHRLPSLCNWISHLALPMADVAAGVLVEPSYPRAPILIVANSFTDKSTPRRLLRSDGKGTLECTLTFSSVRDALTAARASS